MPIVEIGEVTETEVGRQDDSVQVTTAVLVRVTVARTGLERMDVEEPKVIV